MRRRTVSLIGVIVAACRSTRAATTCRYVTTFPYLAPAQGGATPAATTRTTFDFRTDPDSAFVQVDRVGDPVIATALIGSSLKNSYNDASPTTDVSGSILADEKTQLTLLMNSLGDDLTNIQLDVCAKKV